MSSLQFTVRLCIILLAATLPSSPSQAQSLTEIEEDIADLESRVSEVGKSLEGIGDELVSATSELCFMAKPETVSYCAQAAQYLATTSDVADLADHGTRTEAIDLLLQTGCANDDGHACVSFLHPDIHAEYPSSELASHFQKGIRNLGPMCEQGDGAKCMFMANGFWWYSQRAALPEQLQKTMPAALKRSCDLGYVNGCLALASALADGTHGFPQNPDAARNLRTQMCDKEITSACLANRNVGAG